MLTDQRIALTLSPAQLRTVYQALSNVPAECRREMLALFEDNHADWKYQLPVEAYHRMTQLEDRECWAIEIMGIIGAAATIHGIPLIP